MDPEHLKATALVITAVGTPLSLIAVSFIGEMTRRHGKVLKHQDAVLDDQSSLLRQVEKQGNSVALELKRTNMMYSRRLAAVTNNPSDIAIADDAEKVYYAARESAEGKR